MILLWIFLIIFEVNLIYSLIVFGFIGGIILGGLEFLGEIFGGLIGEVLEFFDPLFQFLQDLLDAFSDLITPLMEGFLALLEDLIDDAITLLGTVISDLIDLGADIIFVFWDDVIPWGGASPDILAVIGLLIGSFVAFLGGTLEVLQWTAEMLDFIGGMMWFIWLCVWAWLVLFSALQADGSNPAADWLGRMQNKATTNISPGPISIPIPFIGNIPIIPSKIPLLVLLLIFTSIELGTWDSIIAWVAP